MTATLVNDVLGTQHSTNGTGNVTRRTRHPVDAGNRFIKWMSALNQPRCIPSSIKFLEDWEDAIAPSDDQSVVIESEGKRFVIGQIAKELKGKDVYNRDKCELAKHLILATLEPHAGQSQMLIDVMPVALPDHRNQADVRSLKRLEGTHCFTRNGQALTVKINRVEPVSECYAAWRWAFNHGLYKYRRNNAVLDCGGGTLLGRVITPSGVIDWASEVHADGTFALANRIAAALKPKLSKSPELAHLMDAIADGSFVYHGQGGESIPFSSIFERSRTDWIEDIRASLKERWSAQLSEIGEVLIIGGSAPLLQPLVEATGGRFKIAQAGTRRDFHQFISLYGMLEG